MDKRTQQANGRKGYLAAQAKVKQAAHRGQVAELEYYRAQAVAAGDVVRAQSLDVQLQELAKRDPVGEEGYSRVGFAVPLAIACLQHLD